MFNFQKPAINIKEQLLFCMHRTDLVPSFFFDRDAPHVRTNPYPRSQSLFCLWSKGMFILSFRISNAVDLKEHHKRSVEDRLTVEENML